MISFNYQTDFSLVDEDKLANWIGLVVSAEGYSIREVNYIFCTDQELLRLNQQFLKHDTFTDVIGFDYSVGKQLQGDIYISIERVSENAKEFDTGFEEELRRVMVHGILHFCGYKDKGIEQQELMKAKENKHLESWAGI